jgi:catechol 1,2-dioxygenase
VYSSGCRTPLPKTLIEIWQADAKGFYDKKRPGDFIEPPMPFHLRGMLLTDERGRYEIETIIPGAYPIPPGMPGLEKYGGLTRARHIHISVMPFFECASHDSALLQGRSQYTKRSVGRSQAATCP